MYTIFFFFFFRNVFKLYLKIIYEYTYFCLRNIYEHNIVQHILAIKQINMNNYVIIRISVQFCDLWSNFVHFRPFGLI